MLRSTSISLCTFAALFTAATANAQSTMTPLPTFGTGGWLAPGTSAYLTTGHTERGLAFNPITSHLLLVSRAGGSFVRVLDAATGLDLGGLDTTGMSGGTFALDMCDVDETGAIYVGNLSTSLTSNFKVYKWNDETPAVAPTTVFDALTNVVRTGDAFAVHGGVSGPARFAAAGTAAATAGTNSSFTVGTLDATNTFTSYTSIPGTGAASNDYRLSLTWVDQDTVIGNQGGLARYTDFTASAATVAASIPFTTVSQRAMDYAVVGGVPVLAVIDSVSSIVSIYDVTYPSQPQLLVQGNNTTGTLSANTNATGSVQWGVIGGNTATLYAMSTNHGIQAFLVTIQPAASAVQYGAGCGTPALTLAATLPPVLGNPFDLLTDQIPTTATVGVYALGLVSIPGGVPIPGTSGCNQYVAPLATVFFVTGGLATNQLPQTYPANPAYAGLQIFAQSLVIDPPSTILATNGLRLYLELF
ncbi:MAG: hypothetical protein U1E73_09180 [Planctomycetota bacterium]